VHSKVLITEVVSNLGSTVFLEKRFVNRKASRPLRRG
jgi:hypothetical protein